MASPAKPRVSWVLLVIVVAALAIGAAASILVSAASAPAPSSGPAQLIFLPPWLLTVASIGFLAFVVGSMVLWRLSGGPGQSLNRPAVVILAVILAGLVFVIVVHFLGLGGSLAGTTNSTTSHGQNGSTPPPPPSHSQNVTGSGGVMTWPGLPPWLPFVVLAAVVLLVVVVAVPELRRYVAERRGGAATRPVSAEARGVREALTQASTALSQGEDPRVVILALYAALLARLQPMVLGLDTSTPEEIRTVHLRRLGVRPGPARTLTRLFEEARYSSHPMGAETSRRAQEAVGAVLDDLDRRDFPS